MLKEYKLKEIYKKIYYPQFQNYSHQKICFLWQAVTPKAVESIKEATSS